MDALSAFLTHLCVLVLEAKQQLFKAEQECVCKRTEAAAFHWQSYFNRPMKPMREKEKKKTCFCKHVRLRVFAHAHVHRST